MLWFNFILGLNFILFCFKLIIIHYHTQKQRKIKFKPRIKLNHNIYKGMTGTLWTCIKLHVGCACIYLKCFSCDLEYERKIQTYDR